ncbi:MAG: hypothetical protein LBU45_00050 [Azoarcus sp.]|nr:hypothetical protein [Azoarcus sp.]
MRTYCFGRYLVDIPDELKFKEGGATYQGAIIKIEKTTLSDFNAKVEKVLNDLKEGNRAVDGYKLKDEIEIGDRERILVGHDDVFGSTVYRLDTFKLDRGIAFITSESPYSEKKIEKWINLVSAYIRNVRFRPHDEIPKEPGFCFPNGFVADGNGAEWMEMTNLAFRLRNHPDVRIRIESMLLPKKQPTLLERFNSSNFEARFPGKLKIERVGKLSVNGIPGEEVLGHFPSEDHAGEAHNFIWEAPGETHSILKPYIQLGVTTGEGVPGVSAAASSIETREVLRIYDAIVKTIRLRPTEAKPADAKPVGEQSRLPLGTRVASWQPCPQAGLWECEPPQVEGARRRLFQTGQRLPPVTVPDARSLWQRLRGQPAKCAIDTVWTLVEDVPDA